MVKKISKMIIRIDKDVLLVYKHEREGKVPFLSLSSHYLLCVFKNSRQSALLLLFQSCLDRACHIPSHHVSSVENNCGGYSKYARGKNKQKKTDGSVRSRSM